MVRFFHTDGPIVGTKIFLVQPIEEFAENFLRETYGDNWKNQPEVFEEKGTNENTNRWGRVGEVPVLMKWECIHFLLLGTFWLIMAGLLCVLTVSEAVPAHLCSHSGFLDFPAVLHPLFVVI